MLNRPGAIVCVVDDDSDIRDGVKLLLESVGIGCIAFSSTKEFLESEQIGKANCLILDVRLPGAGGLDLQAELTRAQIDIPIIFISAHGDIPMSVRAIKAGAIEFLTKPFRHQDLVDAINVGIERDRSHRHAMTTLLELQSRFVSLTPRERQIMHKVTGGGPNKQIAAELKLSEFTVQVHRSHVMHKMKAKSLVDLVRMSDRLQDCAKTA